MTQWSYSCFLDNNVQSWREIVLLFLSMTDSVIINTDFILLGLWPQFSHLVIQICLILLVYFMAVMGNVVLILIWLDS